MSSSDPIPLVCVAGTHREVGAQLGAALADVVRRAAAEPFDARLVGGYRAVTVEHLPWVVDELDAVAESAAVDRLAVFAASVERAHRPASAGQPSSSPRASPRDALADHAHAPTSICRHGDGDGTKTVFWCLADVTAGEIAFGRGNACATVAQTYRFGR